VANKLREYKTSMIKKLKLRKGSCIGICLMIDTFVGVVNDNIGIWMSLSICLGLILETFIKNK
jgi:hypothetical protein